MDRQMARRALRRVRRLKSISVRIIGDVGPAFRAFSAGI